MTNDNSQPSQRRNTVQNPIDPSALKATTRDMWVENLLEDDTATTLRTVADTLDQGDSTKIIALARDFLALLSYPPYDSTLIQAKGELLNRCFDILWDAGEIDHAEWEATYRAIMDRPQP